MFRNIFSTEVIGFKKSQDDVLSCSYEIQDSFVSISMNGIYSDIGLWVGFLDLEHFITRPNKPFFEKMLS